MEITIQIGKRIFALSFGYKTAWFESVCFIWLEELWFSDAKTVDFARTIFHS